MKKSTIMSIGLSSIALTMGATNIYASEIGTVNTDGLNVRSGIGTSHSVIAKLNKGNTVEIMDSSSGWYKIKLSNGKIGWSSAKYITTSSSSNKPDTTPEQSTSGYGKVTADSLNIRSGAGTSYSIVTKANRNEKVELLSSSNGWYKVKLSNGKVGWASGQYITKWTSSDSSNDSNNNQGSTISGYGKVTADSLNIRSGAGTSYAIVTKANRNEKVELLASSNGWYKVKLSNGKVGWASSSYITKWTSDDSSNDSNNNQGSNVSGYGKVTTDSLNIRSGAGTNYSIVTKASRNEKVELLSSSNGWYKVKLSNGKVGWASSSYITKWTSDDSSNDSNNNQGSTISGYGKVTADSLNIRSGAGTSYSIVTKAYRNDKVELLSSSNGWYKVKLSNGKVGWASSSYITKWTSGDSSNDNGSSVNKVSAIVNLAKQQIGKPYVWGAEGPNSFDCSGLVYYVYKNAAGITLPRTSTEQSRVGTTVSKSNLKPGDLIFSSTNGTGNVSHVGIYIGNGIMIDAPKPGDVVKQTNINSSYWNDAYLWAKRVL